MEIRVLPIDAGTVNPPGELNEAARELLKYLAEHPAATDTLTGVQTWWLNNRYPLRTVEAVVTMLTERGLLEIDQRVPGTRLVRIRARREQR